MFTHFRRAAKRQAAKPPQNKNSVYIKYGYFMGNPTELTAQRQAEAAMPLPEAEETVLPDTEDEGISMLAVSCVQVITRPGGNEGPYKGIQKKPFMLYRKTKANGAVIIPPILTNGSINTHLPAQCKPHRLHNFINPAPIRCRGGPVILT